MVGHLGFSFQLDDWKGQVVVGGLHAEIVQGLVEAPRG